MSIAIERLLATSLEAMEYWIDDFVVRPETSWHYPHHPNEHDMVVALTDLRVREQGEERLLCVTQWLGREAAFGEVRYSARDMQNGPLIMWQAAPKVSADVVFFDVQQGKRLAHDPKAAARLATLLPHALPYREPVPLPPRPTLMDRAVGVYMQLPGILAE